MKRMRMISAVVGLIGLAAAGLTPAAAQSPNMGAQGPHAEQGQPAPKPQMAPAPRPVQPPPPKRRHHRHKHKRPLPPPIIPQNGPAPR